jgi:CubicO group peptidase (beta-lactamase class C family)
VGVSALVTIDGKEAYFGAFGLADREANRPMARDTVVQIYSMTKPLTDTALMQLWAQGKFHLDDPVSKYISEFANVKVFDGLTDSGAPILVVPNRPFTVRDLTRHTSGLKAGEVGEFFWDGAANTLFWVDPKNKLTAVLFTQYKPFGKVPCTKISAPPFIPASIPPPCHRNDFRN